MRGLCRGEEPGRNVAALSGDTIRHDPHRKHEHPPLCPAGGKHQHSQNPDIYISESDLSVWIGQQAKYKRSSWRKLLCHESSIGEDGWLDGGDDDDE